MKPTQITRCKGAFLFKRRKPAIRNLTNTQEASSEASSSAPGNGHSSHNQAATTRVWAVLPYSKNQRCFGCPAGQTLITPLCYRLFMWAFQRATKSSNTQSCFVTSFPSVTRRHRTSSSRFTSTKPVLYLQITDGTCFTGEMTETHTRSDYKSQAAPGKNPSPQGALADPSPRT